MIPRTVVGFLYHNNKLLIARRSKHHTFLPGYYELPGGKVEEGEDLKDALKRELREELNVNVAVLESFHEFYYFVKGVKKLEIAFFVKLDDDIGNLKLSREHDDLRWISAEEIEKYKISEGEIEAIKVGFRNLK